MSRAIERVAIEDLSKVFGPVRALRRVRIELHAGDSVAVMGPNGAGKSTLLAVLSLTTRPTSGRLLFDGRHVRPADPELRSRIGLLSHQPMVYPDLTGLENLRLFARLYGVAEPDGEVARRAEELGLGSYVADRAVRVLSRGQLQRIALARAMLGTPDLLLLDEPAAGLDREAVRRIARAIGSHRERGGIAVTVTHEPELASEVADRAVMLVRGEVVSDEYSPGSADDWRELYSRCVDGGV
ncbi:MAG: heme ABC exporter ATP-binding protein CcmA [Polyangia bacterium]